MSDILSRRCRRLPAGSAKDRGWCKRSSSDMYKCNAAQFVDSHEPALTRFYITPMRGAQLGTMMNKDAQCLLAQECGFTIPKSFIYKRGDQFPGDLEYPLLLKPVNSTHGEKSDIHICSNYHEVEISLLQTSSCPLFIVQEYIEKEYEINLIGVRTEHGVYVPGWN